VLGNDLILGLVGSGAMVWCIDKGRSYERMITTLGGDHLVFHPESPINLNPFSFIDSPAEFQERITGLKALVAQMASPSRPISDLEDALMGEAIQEAYGTHGHATSITHIAGRLAAHPDPRCHDLATMLYPYTAKGEFARFFEGEATVDVMTSPLLLLELEDLSSKPKLQSVIFLALILAVRAAMERGDRGVQRCLLIDEAWQFIAGSGAGGSGSTQAAQFVTQLYRVARKFNLAAITISQSLADFLDTEAGQAILANSDTRIVYQHKNETLRDPRLAYSPWEATLIRSLTKVSGRYAECFIQHPTGAGIYRHLIDPVAYQLFTTNPEEVARLQALMKHQHRSLAEAVQELAGQDAYEKPVPANIAQALA
jgi:conjugal transfer ATP-binding protein TraC